MTINALNLLCIFSIQTSVHFINMAAKKIKKIIKVTSISIIASIIGLTLLTSAVLSIYLSPKKLTPIVKNVMAQNIDGEIELGSVNLMIIRSFPNIGVRINDFSIRPHNSDSTLARMKTLIVTANPFAYLSKKEININKIILSNPDIYMHIDEKGVSNMDFLSSTDTTTQTSADTTSLMKDMSINVKRIKILNGQITLDDRSTKLYTDLNHITLTAHGDLSSARGNIALQLSADSILLWKDGELLMNRIAFNTKTEAGFDRDSSLIRLGKTFIDINGLKLGAKGYLKGHKTEKTAEVDLGFFLASSSPADVLSMIPSSIVKKDAKMTAKGEASLAGRLTGIYGQGKLPSLEAKLNIDKASAHYRGKKTGIEELTLKMNCLIDFEKRDASYVNIDKFFFRGGLNNQLDMSANIKSALNNPQISFNTDCRINFESIGEIFPLQEGVSFKGSNTTVLKGAFTMKDIKRGDYGKINLDGESMFNNMHLIINASMIDTTQSGYLYVSMNEGKFKFGHKAGSNTGFLGAAINFNGLGFKDKLGREIFLTDIDMGVKSKMAVDTTRITDVEGQLVLGGIKLRVQDTIASRLSKSTMQIHITGGNDSMAHINTLLTTDSLYFAAMQTKTAASLSRARLEMNFTPSKQKGVKWPMNGNMSFRNLQIYSDIFPIKIAMPSSRFSIENESIKLNNAFLKIGNSRIRATGSIDSLMNVLVGNGQKMYGELNIKASRIYLGEILYALNNSSANNSDTTDTAQQIAKPDSLLDLAATSEIAFSDTITSEDFLQTTDVVQSQIDTSSIGVFMVPEGLDFKMHLDVDSARLGTLHIENLLGDIAMRNGLITMRNLTLNVIDAKLETSAFYRAENSSHADLGLNLAVKGINIARIGELMPSLDSLLPMIKSFSGIVDMSMIAGGTLNKEFNFDLKSLSSILQLMGQNITVKDDETVRTIAKMLMFKDKTQTTIDTLAINAIVRDGNVDVLPFEATVDRYRVIIGGTQDFDMNFNYNISIMKSPLPFKAGVDIFGNMDDFDFKITKAKLKKTDFAIQQTNVDSAKIVLWNRIKQKS